MSRSLPRIAVLIAAYNAESTLNKAIHSLNENDEPHDIIIVDDGSRFPVSNFIVSQPNLVLLRSEKNQGLPKARNVGLAYILSKSYEYIAILDADDVAAPNRLSLQRIFLDEHQDVALAGSWVRIVSEDGKLLNYLNLPEEHSAIVIGLFYNSCVIHSSLMVRADLFRKVGVYNEKNYLTCEDYYITRNFLRHHKMVNLPHYLVDYTISSRGVTQTRTFDQMRCRLLVQWEYRNLLNVHFYIGISKTLVQMTLFFATARRHKKQLIQKITSTIAPPVLEWKPFRGQVAKKTET